jgi:hypothetical protein
MTAASDPSAVLSIEQTLASARAAEEAGDHDRALGHFRTLELVEPDQPRWRFESVRILRLAGREKEAAEGLRSALRRWRGALRDPEIRALIPEAVDTTGDTARAALGENCPPDSALKREVVVDDDSDIISVKGGKPAAVVVFTGLADRMLVPLPLFDRYLAELDLSAIYLRDRNRIGFFDGVKSIGGYNQTVATLRKRLKDLGADTVHTVGNSAGGIGALSYGLDLGAKHIIGFSTPTLIASSTGQHDRRAMVFLERMLGGVPAARRDLRQRFLDTPDHGEVHLFYGQDMPEDRMHAQVLAGLPGVTLYPLPGLAGHGALFRLAQAGHLRTIFAKRFV